MADASTSTPAAPPAPVAPAAAPTADVLNLRSPALSATSDMPVLSPAPAPAATAPAAAPSTSGDAAAAAAAAEAAAAEGDEADAAGKGKDNTPAWQKAEITKERNRRRAAETRAEEAERARADADRRLEEALKAIPKPAAETPPAPPPPAEPPRPKRPLRENFEDPDAFDAALNAHEDALIEWTSNSAATKAAAAAADAAKKASEEATAKVADDARKAAEQASVEKMQADWSANRAKAIEQMPDYAEVAERADLQISLAMASVITTREDGPQLAYHLGKNPEIAARLAALTPPQAVFEMGLLAAELKAPKPPELTKAPDPVRTVGARAAATRKGPEEESMDEYAARRKTELRGATH